MLELRTFSVPAVLWPRRGSIIARFNPFLIGQDEIAVGPGRVEHWLLFNYEKPVAAGPVSALNGDSPFRMAIRDVKAGDVICLVAFDMNTYEGEAVNRSAINDR